MPGKSIFPLNCRKSASYFAFIFKTDNMHCFYITFYFTFSDMLIFLFDECLEVQKCISNECKAVACDCGVIENHTCIEYECCSNFDCSMNEECDLSAHTCNKRSLTILAPESVVAGQQFTIGLVGQNGNPVAGAKIKVEYSSGVAESLTTDENGEVSLAAKESGTIFIIADMVGYDRETLMAEVTPGINLTAMLLLIIIMAGAGCGFFYWKQLPPITLKKSVNGQDVTLKVKNSSGECMENVIISDTVPAGAFLSCGLTPRMENFGNETHLTWFANLNEGKR